MGVVTKAPNTSAIFNFLFDGRHPFLGERSLLEALPNVEVEQLASPKQMEKDNRRFAYMIRTMNASMNTPSTYSSLRKTLARCFGSCFYPCAQEKAKRQALLFRA